MRAARDGALGDVVVDRRVDKWDRGEVDLGVKVCPLTHLDEVAEKAEAGDVGEGVDVREGAEGGAEVVEADHGVAGQGGVLRTQDALLFGRGEDADT